MRSADAIREVAALAGVRVFPTVALRGNGGSLWAMDPQRLSDDALLALAHSVCRRELIALLLEIRADMISDEPCSDEVEQAFRRVCMRLDISLHDLERSMH